MPIRLARVTTDDIDTQERITVLGSVLKPSLWIKSNSDVTNELDHNNFNRCYFTVTTERE